MNVLIFLSVCYFGGGKQEPERKVHRVREEILQLRAQKSNLEISLCDLNKVIVLWTGKLADIREAQSYYQAERSDAGSLALLQAEKHRLQVRPLLHQLPPPTRSIKVKYYAIPISCPCFDMFYPNKVQEVQLRKDQELLNHQLQKAVLGRSVLNTKADIRTGVGHKMRIVKEPVDSNAWHKILSKEIAKRRKVRQFGRDGGSYCRKAQKLSRCVTLLSSVPLVCRRGGGLLLLLLD